jgi:citrate lyase beta subunit
MDNPLLSMRTILFTPGNRPDRFEKAHALGADGVAIDLEDAISLAGKDEARQIVLQYFKNSKPIPSFLRCLRVNSIKTPAGLKDFSAIIDQQVFPDAFIFPKVESAAEVRMIDGLLKKNIPYFVLIETAIGISHAEEIASSSSNVKAICFGGGDFAADIGAVLAWEPMLMARSRVVCAAATAGVACWDVPYMNLQDADDTGIIEETRKVKALGYTGKFAIHPKHLKPILDVFTPTQEEVAFAQKVIDAYKAAKGNVCEVGGKMIDAPIVHSAERILALAHR